MSTQHKGQSFQRPPGLIVCRNMKYRPAYPSPLRFEFKPEPDDFPFRASSSSPPQFDLKHDAHNGNMGWQRSFSSWDMATSATVNDPRAQNQYSNANPYPQAHSSLAYSKWDNPWQDRGDSIPYLHPPHDELHWDNGGLCKCRHQVSSKNELKCLPSNHLAVDDFLTGPADRVSYSQLSMALDE